MLKIKTEMIYDWEREREQAWKIIDLELIHEWKISRVGRAVINKLPSINYYTYYISVFSWHFMLKIFIKIVKNINLPGNQS